MEGDDDRTFRANFTSEGVAKLRALVNEKLKEFMGDYTDDTLVEYVIVLLKNGRRKDEAKNELDVFLGEDSDSFVSWLWDHLGSNLNLYVQPQETHPDGDSKTKSAAREEAGIIDAHQIESDHEDKNTKRTSGNRRNREWKGLVRDEDEKEVSHPQSSKAENINAQDDHLHRKSGHTKRSLSPQPSIQKKRRRSEERRSRKREVSQTTVSAPRRLLQFAVRDAVATSRPNSSGEPSLKRLRSVVSTAAGDSVCEERPQKTRPVAEFRTAMSAAIKAVAEAVKDVSKVRTSRNVFDRLGNAADVPSARNDHVDHIGVAEDGLDGDFSDDREDIRVTYHQQIDSHLLQDGNMSSFHDDTMMHSDLRYDVDEDDVDAMGRGSIDASRAGISGGNWVEDSSVFEYGEAEERGDKSRKDLNQPGIVSHPSLKIASAVNVNARGPPQYQEVREVPEMTNHKLIHDSVSMGMKSEAWLMKENDNSLVAVNGNAKPDTGPPHESQKTQTPSGLYSSGPPTEDADSRTIYVTNVHFAATKDTLLRHFNKFGDVLKVIILTDPTTGQPKGSAYIEFMRKEAAEHALSLDGTSFMSRILKIVKKTSAQPEAASVMAWPRAARASPFGVPRFGRAPFPRAMPSLYRGRVPMKPGARSFQWKREAQPPVSETSGQPPSGIVQPLPTRSLTYVRTEPKAEAKTNGSSGVA